MGCDRQGTEMGRVKARGSAPANLDWGKGMTTVPTRRRGNRKIIRSAMSGGDVREKATAGPLDGFSRVDFKRKKKNAKMELGLEGLRRERCKNDQTATEIRKQLRCLSLDRVFEWAWGKKEAASQLPSRARDNQRSEDRPKTKPVDRHALGEATKGEGV